MKNLTGLQLDHLLIAAPDLNQGCDYAECIFGIRPLPGGSHPGIGTRNALLGLADNVYIEIIAPDPGQGTDLPLSQYLSNLKSPGLMWWAARCSDIQAVRQVMVAKRIDVGDAVSWSRKLPDGASLGWMLLMPTEDLLGSAMPFFIQWDDMKLHPAKSLPIVGKLASLQIAHPDAPRIQSVLGESFEIHQHVAAGIAVKIATEMGPVSLTTPAVLPPAIGCIL